MSETLLLENKYFNAYCGSLTCDTIITQNPIALFCRGGNGEVIYNENNVEVPIELDGIVKYSNGIYIDPEDNRKIRFTKKGIYSFSTVTDLISNGAPLVDDATACFSLYSQLKQYNDNGDVIDNSPPISSTFNISASYNCNNSVIGSFNVDDLTQYIVIVAGIQSNGGLTINWRIPICEVKIDFFAVSN